MENKKDVIELVLFDVFYDQVVSRILTTVPFFGLPVIKQITLFALRKLLKLIYDEAKLYNAFLKIDAKIDGEVKEYSDAKEKAKEDPSEENIKNLKEKFRNLIDMRDAA